MIHGDLGKPPLRQLKVMGNLAVVQIETRPMKTAVKRRHWRCSDQENNPLLKGLVVAVEDRAGQVAVFLANDYVREENEVTGNLGIVFPAFNHEPNGVLLKFCGVGGGGRFGVPCQSSG